MAPEHRDEADWRAGLQDSFVAGKRAPTTDRNVRPAGLRAWP
jgi:hypothetical protein